MYYQNLFNEQYINQELKKMQEQQFHFEQQKEICKMAKSLNDFIDSANKIAPQYQGQALDACIAIIGDKLFGNKV